MAGINSVRRLLRKKLLVGRGAKCPLLVLPCCALSGLRRVSNATRQSDSPQLNSSKNNPRRVGPGVTGRLSLITHRRPSHAGARLICATRAHFQSFPEYPRLSHLLNKHSGVSALVHLTAAVGADDESVHLTMSTHELVACPHLRSSFAMKRGGYNGRVFSFVETLCLSICYSSVEFPGVHSIILSRPARREPIPFQSRHD
jgi:hypothetical protein